MTTALIDRCDACLWVIQKLERADLGTQQARVILHLLRAGRPLTSHELEKRTDYNRATLTRLIRKGYVTKHLEGTHTKRGATYSPTDKFTQLIRP